MALWRMELVQPHQVWPVALWRMTNGITEEQQVLQRLVEVQSNEGRRELPLCGMQHLLLGFSSLPSRGGVSPRVGFVAVRHHWLGLCCCCVGPPVWRWNRAGRANSKNDSKNARAGVRYAKKRHMMCSGHVVP